MNDSFLYPFLNRPKVRVKNTSGLAIPTGGVMRVTGGSFDGKTALVSVAQQDSTLRRRYLVNCGPTINAASDSRGWGTSLSIAGLALYDNASGTPALDEEWGPKASSWLLNKNYPGFLITGGSQTFGSYFGVVATHQWITTIIGKIDDTNVALGDICTVSVWDADQANDTFLNITGVRNRGKALTSVANSFCGVSWSAGKPVLMWVACP